MLLGELLPVLAASWVIAAPVLSWLACVLPHSCCI